MRHTTASLTATFVIAVLVALAIGFAVGENLGAGGSPIMGDGSVTCDVWEDGSATCEFMPGRKWAENGGTLSGCLTAESAMLCTD